MDGAPDKLPSLASTFKSTIVERVPSFKPSCSSSCKSLLEPKATRLNQMTGQLAASKQQRQKQSNKHGHDDTKDSPRANATDSVVALAADTRQTHPVNGQVQLATSAYHATESVFAYSGPRLSSSSCDSVVCALNSLSKSYDLSRGRQSRAIVLARDSSDSIAISLSGGAPLVRVARQTEARREGSMRSGRKITTNDTTSKHWAVNNLHSLHPTSSVKTSYPRQSSASRLSAGPLSWAGLMLLAQVSINLLCLGPSSSLSLVAAKPVAQAMAANYSDEHAASNRTATAGPTRDELRGPKLGERPLVNMSNVFEMLLKKRPFSKYLTVEQKWDDLFRRAMAARDAMRPMMTKSFMRDIEQYADFTISSQCEKDLKFVQNYFRHSTNFRWVAHMFDSTGKGEPGMLTGQLAHLGHPLQCIRVRAPSRPSNETFDERFFEKQTELLGERFRGKYCVASVRPVMPPRRANVVVSRFSQLMNESLLSNISYSGEPAAKLKQRARQMSVPSSAHLAIDRHHLRLDQVPFESELYQYLIAQRNFIYSLPRFMGVCYPSSCTREDIRTSIQKSMDEQHQVVDIEFECEQEETDSWDFFITPRLVAYVLLSLVGSLIFFASFTRYILLSKLQIKRARIEPESNLANLLNALDMLSIDKCAGILFIKTKRASSRVDWTKVENNRSTSIDALKGSLILLVVYSQMTLLGCLPVPFMWTKWSDAMFPFFRSLSAQFFINVSIWSEAFYMISAYLIGLKIMENMRPKGSLEHQRRTNPLPLPNLYSYVIKRYVRLALPMLAFILFNYVWPRLSNGFVMQDQANKLMRPCDSHGWTNFLMFHNNQPLKETCLWPSHVSASFFQLHLLSYPLIVLCLVALQGQFNMTRTQRDTTTTSQLTPKLLTWLSFGLILTIALLGAIYPALQASQQSLIVPFLIDYIDYDNYQRVLEWIVTPTHNHITSYMFGLLLAFVVIRQKASREWPRIEASQWITDGQCSQQREGSPESLRSSSTQELNQQHDGLTFKQPHGISVGSPTSSHMGGGKSHSGTKFQISTGPSSICASSEHIEVASRTARPQESRLWSWAKSLACSLVCLLCSLSSWFWNGLGQPMSEQQTFWYVILTKLCFCTTFAYLFYKHLATRRNSSNPWMVTRFLVPIGRMSLTIFYVSWLVIWFDLLSSLYQWHPSHYFIFEKYNEIIFITLILGMFIYGAFEGIVKRLQYASRFQRLKRDMGQPDCLPSDKSARSMTDATSTAAIWQATPPVFGSKCQPLQVKPFESFFDPRDKPTLSELYKEIKSQEAILAHKRDQARAHASETDRANRMNSETRDSSGQQPQQQLPVVGIGQQSFTSKYNRPGQQAGARPAHLATAGGSFSPNLRHLTPRDRYKMNAELRANYSFASIGLYESAGATGDLSHLSNGSGGGIGGDDAGAGGGQHKS